MEKVEVKQSKQVVVLNNGTGLGKKIHVTGERWPGVFKH